MERKKKHSVAVLTADIIQSTRYSQRERQQLNRVLLKSFREVDHRYSKAVHTPLTFRITAGDEFQCVFVDIPKTFEILTYLRATVIASGLKPPVRFRASIGVGQISVVGKSNSYEEDGEAFVRSRRGLEQLEKSRHTRWTRIVTGQPDLDQPVDVILLLLDHMQQRWTLPQWEAVRWSLRNLTREEISRKLKVAHQNVTKRLSAAGWQQFRSGSAFVASLLAKSVEP